MGQFLSPSTHPSSQQRTKSEGDGSTIILFWTLKYVLVPSSSLGYKAKYFQAVQAQNEMYKIQNTRSISYAGAYLKYGFHEDGFTSGLLAACSVDDDQESLPSSASFTAALTGMTIPTRKLTVHPPFEIEHADHHIRLSLRGSENLANALLAQIFDYFETSGARGFIGTVGAIVLGIVAWLLGIQEL